ncbi:hypothetical protein AMECASPLE_025487 [Ameca splendens]|uniref:Secreted protein n=1 Tax=Ameca splendens TaxID=208324 RepID=A0ABV1AC19_9TELE
MKKNLSVFLLVPQWSTHTRTHAHAHARASLSEAETPRHPAGARARQPSGSARGPLKSTRRSITDTHLVEDELQGAVETHDRRAAPIHRETRRNTPTTSPHVETRRSTVRHVSDPSELSVGR